MRGRSPKALKNIWRQELAVLTAARPQVPQHRWGGSLPACCPASHPSPQLSWYTLAKEESARMTWTQENVEGPGLLTAPDEGGGNPKSEMTDALAFRASGGAASRVHM